MPYHGAFTANSERVLIPHVPRIKEAREVIRHAFDGERSSTSVPGDFSLLLYPLPKIALCYVFYIKNSVDPDFQRLAKLRLKPTSWWRK